MRILAIAVLIAACTKPNPNVCCIDEADCNAKGIPVGSVCGDGLLCRGNQCIAQPCTSAAQCDPAAPYCVAELCAEACTDDAQCPGAGESLEERFCVAGDCVSCRSSADCTSDAPVCEGGACRTCVAHEECDSMVCDAGHCVPETQVAYAAPIGSETSGCTLDAPCTIDRAFAVVDSSRNVIRLSPGTHAPANDYGWVFDGTFQLTIYGPGVLAGILQLSQPASAVGMHVRLRELTGHVVVCASSNSTYGIPTLELDRVMLVDEATGQGRVQANRCKLFMRNSRIQRSAVGAALINRATIRPGELAVVESSIIETPDGGPGNGPYPIQLADGSRLEMKNSVVRGGISGIGAIFFNGDVGASTIAFSTFYNTTLMCPSGALIVSAHDNIFLNEIADAPADTVTGSSCSHRYSIVKPQAGAVTGTNNLVDMDPRFVDGANGDFHLLPGSPAIDAADPTATETVDLEGTARPQGAGRDIGAFEYKGM